MKPVTLGTPPADDKGKLDWCVDAIRKIALASKTYDPNVYADGFTLTNITEDRVLDCDSTSTAELADVLATFIRDHQRRGAKQES
jgi:hypothetical protein